MFFVKNHGATLTDCDEMIDVCDRTMSCDDRLNTGLPELTLCEKQHGEMKTIVGHV